VRPEGTGGFGRRGESGRVITGGWWVSVPFRRVRGMSGQRFRRTSGGWLGLHLVWCPKCRRRVLGGWVACRRDELIEQLAGEHGGLIVAHDVMPDHVYLYVWIGPRDSPAAVVWAFNGCTAWVLRAEVPYLGQFANVLWLPSYLAAAVGYVSETTVCRDIEQHGDAVAA